MAKFVVMNTSKANINFTVFTPSPPGTEMMAKHKRRKARNSDNLNVSLKPNNSVDLVELTGLTIKELMDNVEVRELVRVKTDRVKVVIEEDKPEPKPKKAVPSSAPEPPPVVEPPLVDPVPPPPVESEDEKKSSGKKSKKSKKK